MLAVLYEDRRGSRKDFGFHLFICRCVLDRSPGLAVNMFQLSKTVEAIPLKGNGNVFGKCKKDLKKLADRCQRVFAVYDQDKVNELLNLKGPQCRGTLKAGLAAPCEPKEALEVILINRNLESVIETIRDSGLLPSVGSEDFSKALSKDLNARDSLFIKCAKGPQDARAKWLALLPDVDRLVSKIVESLSKTEAP